MNAHILKKNINKIIKFLVVVSVFLLFTPITTQAKITNIPTIPIELPADHSNHFNTTTEIWMFSGKVTTEEGQPYIYMFTFKRKNNQWHVFVNLIDLITQKEVLLYQYTEKDASIKVFQEANQNTVMWRVGKAFMNYNVIGDSWFFGVLDEKNGFNFRVKGIRNYVLNGHQGYLQWFNDNAFQASYSAQNMGINGHLTLEGNNTFVTGEHSWFEHRWGSILAGHQTAKYALITCRFADNTGLMLYEWLGNKNKGDTRLKTGTYQDALNHQKTLADFYLSRSVKTQQWTISVPALNMYVTALSDKISEYDVIPVKKPKNGYCFISQKGY